MDCWLHSVANEQEGEGDGEGGNGETPQRFHHIQISGLVLKLNLEV